MEGDDETLALEAVLGLSPQIFINEVLNMVDDVRFQAFEYCLQEGAPTTVGAATATNKAEELKRGVNAICNLVTDVLNKRMSNWEMYCLRKCLTVPERFVAPEDANTESEELQREITSLERQATYKSSLNSSISEVLKLYEDKSVQENFQAILKAIPKLHEKMKVMKRKKVEVEAMVGQNVWNVDCLRDQKRLASGSTPSAEDIQEVNAAVKGLRKE